MMIQAVFFLFFALVLLNFFMRDVVVLKLMVSKYCFYVNFAFVQKLVTYILFAFFGLYQLYVVR